MRHSLKIGLISAVLLLPPLFAGAYLPPVEEVFQRILVGNRDLTRAIIHLRSVVFDPFPEGDPASSSGQERLGSAAGNEGGAEPVPRELVEREFFQTVYWVRNVFLAIETSSREGTPLHFYMDENFRPVAVNLQPERPFSAWDVRLPFLPFMEDSTTDVAAALDSWGLQLARVRLVRGSKGAIWFGLEESPEKFLIVNRKNSRPLKLQTQVQGAETPRTLTIEFSEYLQIGDRPLAAPIAVFPRTINYLLDGRLFKQTTLLRFQYMPAWNRFPLTKLRNKGRRFIEPRRIFLLGEDAP